jgi:hypothetical protein
MLGTLFPLMWLIYLPEPAPALQIVCGVALLAGLLHCVARPMIRALLVNVNFPETRGTALALLKVSCEPRLVSTLMAVQPMIRLGWERSTLDETALQINPGLALPGRALPRAGHHRAADPRGVNPLTPLPSRVSQQGSRGACNCAGTPDPSPFPRWSRVDAFTAVVAVGVTATGLSLGGVFFTLEADEDALQHALSE